MFINLNEISEEGKSWQLSKQSGELNSILQDLIGTQDYQIEFLITPLPTSGSYTIAGQLQTKLSEQCSRCGIDFKFPIKERFQHILMPALSTPRAAKSAKTNHFSDLHAENIEVFEYHGNVFAVGEFFHELIGLAEPVAPAPDVDKSGRCLECKISVKEHSFNYEENLGEPTNPFARLKGIKLN